jgi:bifunctional non-homologous end joining protein LigD
VRPEVVVEARMLGLTRDGRLRQPAYLGVRSDLTAEDLMADAVGGDPQ